MSGFLEEFKDLQADRGLAGGCGCCGNGISLQNIDGGTVGRRKFVHGKDAIAYSEGMHLWYYPASIEAKKEVDKAFNGMKYNADVKIDMKGFESEVHVLNAARKMYKSDSGSNVFIVKINKNSQVNLSLTKIQGDENWKEMAFIFFSRVYGSDRLNITHVPISCSAFSTLCTRLVHLIFYSCMVHGFFLACLVGKERIHDVGRAIALLGGSTSAYVLSLYIYSILKCLGLAILYCLLFFPIVLLSTLEERLIDFTIIFLQASNLINATYVTACLIFHNMPAAITASTVFHVIMYLAACSIRCDHQIDWWSIFTQHQCFTSNCCQSNGSCFSVVIISYILYIICGCLIYTLKNCICWPQFTNSETDSFQVIEQPLLDNEDDIAIKIKCVDKKQSVLPQNFTLKIPNLKTTVILDPSGTCQAPLLEAVVGKRSVAGGTVSVEKALKSTVCMCSYHDFIWDLLTVKETLNIYCKIVGHTNQGMDIVKNTMDDFNLGDKLKIRVHDLSSLDKKLLMLAVTFLSNAEILILDDPTKILTDKSLNLLISCIKKKKGRATILMTCSHGEDALRVADRIAIVVCGKIRVFGTIRFATRCLGIGTHMKIQVCSATIIKRLYLYIWLFAPNCVCLKKLNSEDDIDDDTSSISLNFFIDRADKRVVEFVILNIRSRMREFGIIELTISDVGIETILNRCKSRQMFESLLYVVYFNGAPIREIIEGSQITQIEQWLHNEEAEEVVKFSNVRKRESLLYASVSSTVTFIRRVKSDMSFQDFMKVITQRYNLKSMHAVKSQTHQESGNCVESSKVDNKSNERSVSCSKSGQNNDHDKNNSSDDCVDHSVRDVNNSVDDYKYGFEETSCHHSANNTRKMSQSKIQQLSFGEEGNCCEERSLCHSKCFDVMIWGLVARDQTPIQDSATNSIAPSHYEFKASRVIWTHIKALLRMSLCHHWRCLPLVCSGTALAFLIANLFFYLNSNQLDLMMERTKIIDIKEYLLRDFGSDDITHIDGWAVNDSAEHCKHRNDFSCVADSVVTGSVILNGTKPGMCLFYNEKSHDAKLLSIVEALENVGEKIQGRGNPFERLSVFVNPLPLFMEECREQLISQMQFTTAQTAHGFSLASVCLIVFMILAYLFKAVNLLILSGVSGILVFVVQCFVCIALYFIIMLLLHISVVMISLMLDNDWKCLWDMEISILLTVIQLSYSMSVFGFVTLCLQLVSSKMLIGMWSLFEVFAFGVSYISLTPNWMELFQSPLVFILFITSPIYGYTKSISVILQHAAWKMIVADYLSQTYPDLEGHYSFKYSLACLRTHKCTNGECFDSVSEISSFCVFVHLMHCGFCMFVYVITYIFRQWLTKEKRYSVSSITELTKEGKSLMSIKLFGLQVHPKYRAQSKADDIFSLCKPSECLVLYGSKDNSGASSIIQLVIGQDMYCDRQVSMGGQYFPQFDLFASHQRMSVGYCPSRNELNPVLTGRDVLQLFATLRNCVEANREADELLSTFSLTDVADNKIYTYSLENKRKLHVALAFVGDPPILLLDHPTQDVLTLAKIEIWKFINAQRLRGRVIILASDCAEESCALGSRILVLKNGCIRLDDDIQNIKQLSTGYFVYVWLSTDYSGTPVPVVRAIRGVQRRFNSGMFSFVNDVRDQYLLFSFAHLVPEFDHAKIYDCMEELKEACVIRCYNVKEITPPLILESYKNIWLPY